MMGSFLVTNLRENSLVTSEIGIKGDYQLYDRVLHPTIMTVTNRWTHETVGWNPLRVKKPTSADTPRYGSLKAALLQKPSEEKKFVDDLMANSSGNCDFCAKNRTAVPAFGRVENDLLEIYTAANVFSYFDMAGLIIPRKAHDFR